METQRNKLTATATMIAVGIVGCILTAPAKGSTIGNDIPAGVGAQQVNALVALEATQNDLTLIASAFPQPVPAQGLGTWSGTISAAGWALNFVGQIDGTGISIQETGVLDEADSTSSWIDSGSVGSQPMSGFGSMNLDSLDWSQTLVDPSKVTAAQTVACLLQPEACVWIVLASQLVSDTNNNLDANSYIVQQSASLSRLGSTDTFNDAFSVTAVGTLNSSTGAATFQSSIASAPEPSTMALLMGGGLLIAFGRLRSRKWVLQRKDRLLVSN